MNRFSLMILAALAVASVAGTAKADDQTFDFSAYATDGGAIPGGTLTFTIDTSDASPAADQYTSGAGLLSFDFVIDGTDFSLADEIIPGSTFVQMDDGDLTDVSYFGTPDFVNTLSINGLTYEFGDAANGDSSSGILAVPEPASMAILVAGLAGLTYVRRRKAI